MSDIDDSAWFRPTETRRQTAQRILAGLRPVDNDAMTPAQLEHQKRVKAAALKKHDQYFGVDPDDHEAIRARLHLAKT